MLVDLHLHTTASDGTWSAEQTFDYVRESAVQLFSITDHDLPQEFEVPDDLRDRYVPGVEVDACLSGRTVHLLLYGRIPQDSDFANALTMQRAVRRQRVKAIVTRLRSLHLPLTVTDVFAQAGKGCASLGRPHVARAMVRRGFVSSVREAFDAYLSESGPAYVPLERMQAQAVIEAAHALNLLAVLAHPQRLLHSEDAEDLCRYGIDGIEIVHPSAPVAIQHALRELANAYGLLQTGGSDSHGYEYPQPAVMADSDMSNFLERVRSCLVG